MLPKDDAVLVVGDPSVEPSVLLSSGGTKPVPVEFSRFPAALTERLWVSGTGCAIFLVAMSMSTAERTKAVRAIKPASKAVSRQMTITPDVCRRLAINANTPAMAYWKGYKNRSVLLVIMTVTCAGICKTYVLLFN